MKKKILAIIEAVEKCAKKDFESLFYCYDELLQEVKKFDKRQYYNVSGHIVMAVEKDLKEKMYVISEEGDEWVYLADLNLDKEAMNYIKENYEQTSLISLLQKATVLDFEEKFTDHFTSLPSVWILGNIVYYFYYHLNNKMVVFGVLLKEVKGESFCIKEWGGERFFKDVLKELEKILVQEGVIE